jgi:transcriptional regulator NrdR family protein
MSFRVVKRDKQIEDFNHGKIKNVIMAAGLSEEEANKVMVELSKWAEGTGKPLITTIQLRDHIIVEMQKINHNAAINFINYEKDRDKHLGGPVS